MSTPRVTHLERAASGQALSRGIPKWDKGPVFKKGREQAVRRLFHASAAAAADAAAATTVVVAAETKVRGRKPRSGGLEAL